MRLFGTLLGKMIYGLARAHSFLWGGLIYAVETGVLLAKSFLKGCVILMGMGGCLAFFLVIGPLSSWLLRNPLALLFFILFLSLPILGAMLIPYLKYFQSVSTQYLVNLSLFLQNPKKHAYRPYRAFKQAYYRAQEEAARREQARREQQRRAWEERFRQWNQYQQYGDTYRPGGQRTTNPYEDFRQKFEKSCDILGVSYHADASKIKLAYRRKAKTYHPDVNKDPNATAQFQKISEAYEFLNEDNIQRYRKLGQNRS